MLAVLAGPIDQPGDIAEQLASRQEIVTNKAAMELATTLYIDMKSKHAKKGAAQFDLTWDRYMMQTADLLKMMPREFNRFRWLPFMKS